MLPGYRQAQDKRKTQTIYRQLTERVAKATKTRTRETSKHPQSNSSRQFGAAGCGETVSDISTQWVLKSGGEEKPRDNKQGFIQLIKITPLVLGMQTE